ncbi:hypothetical protein Poli38472_009085 [Pythium oligandrum]|uniref:RNA helicase n=1 Tax=Pythium oligandrum TaxID=41045 RepID=A0A8K1FNS3_PYTOL|nr:hypothetical protein Poli38472_009085 [Pythium oligandrum]|eukprot:TMW64918.1 hypothetical protein Poli38472_009085 [Pythium oligandrum]
MSPFKSPNLGRRSSPSGSYPYTYTKWIHLSCPLLVHQVLEAMEAMEAMTHAAESVDYVDDRAHADVEEEEEAPVVMLSEQQRAPVDGEPVCVICGRYGEYICDATDEDVCSLECRDICTQRHKEKEMTTVQAKGPETEVAALEEDHKALMERKQQSSELRRSLKIRIEVIGQGTLEIPDLVAEFAGCPDIPIALWSNMHKQGYETPTPVQMQAIPCLLEGQHVLLTAPTGMGKTAAFLIPLISQIIKMQANDPPQTVTFGLVLAPIRELAIQIEEEIKSLVAGIPFMRTALIIGGVPIPPQVHRLIQGVQVLVATPGRLLELLSREDLGLSMETLLDGVRFCVVDEVDMMLSAGFRDQIMTIMSQLSTEERVQFAFVSATASSEAKRVVRDLIQSSDVCLHITAGEIANLGTQAKNLTVNLRIHQKVVWAEESAKKNELFAVLGDEEARQTMVFVESKLGADMLAKAVKQRCNVEAASFHADKSQKDRLLLLERFVNQDIAVMVTTSVLGRGIDLLNVDRVVVFDAPRSVAEYVHLIGRAGRREESFGTSIMFVNAKDASILEEAVRVARQAKGFVSHQVYSHLHALKKPKVPVQRVVDESIRAFKLVRQKEDVEASSRDWKGWTNRTKRSRFS